MSWNFRNVVRNRKLDAFPNNSGLIELFAFSSPSTGSEHNAIVSLVAFRSLDRHRQHPKKLQLSAVNEQFVAIFIRSPSFKCLRSLSVQQVQDVGAPVIACDDADENFLKSQYVFIGPPEFSTSDTLCRCCILP